MPTPAYDAMLGRCPRATVGAPDDDIFGQTIQPALDHIDNTPVAHSCAKETETLQVCTGRQEGFDEAETAKYVPRIPADAVVVQLYAYLLYYSVFSNTVLINESRSRGLGSRTSRLQAYRRELY